jgi:hypothetical protein
MFEKPVMLEQIRTERAAFEARLQALPAGILTQPAVPGRMSVKEEVYHIAWHEREMVGLLRSHALIGSPWWNLTTDERNANIQAEAAPLAIESVLSFAETIFRELLEALEAVPEDALNDPASFANMPAEWIPGELIAQNTYEHYREHL